MDIQFIKGKMIITHASGHVDKYQKTDLEQWKIMELKKQEETLINISIINSYIQKIQTSIGVI